MARPTSSIRDIANLLPKFDDPDSDIRFMSLADLCQSLESSQIGFMSKDYNACAHLIDAILKLLDDNNGDVQSQALKCIGPLASRCPPEILPVFIEKLTSIDVTKTQDHSIPSTATRYLVISFPRPTPGVQADKAVEDAYEAISRVLIPRLLGKPAVLTNVSPKKSFNFPDPPHGMLDIDPRTGADVDAIDLLNEAVRCFGPLLKDNETEALLKKLMEIIDSNNTGIVGKKKTVAAMSVLVVYLSDQLLSSFVSDTLADLRRPELPAAKRRFLISMLGSITHSIPRRFGFYLSVVAPLVLQALDEEEFSQLLEEREDDGTVDSQTEEVKEAALVALENFLSSCVTEMRPFTNEALDASIRYLGYDPSIVTDSDEEMDAGDGDTENDEGNLNGEEDFEEEEALSDTDDASWKIRRCASKSLYALISTRALDLMSSGVFYDKIAPFLIRRFAEREENVRLEILSTMTLLILKTAEIVPDTSTAIAEDTPSLLSQTSNSRKRRRGESDASLFDTSFAIGAASPGQTPSPVSGARAELSRLGPSIIQNAVKAFNRKDIATKEGTIVLLKEYAHLKHGGLTGQLDQLMEPLMSIIGATGSFMRTPSGISSSAGSTTGNSLRIESLNFLLAICETHSSTAIGPHLDTIVPGLVSAINDKYFKISCQAIDVSEGVVKVLTPPRSIGSDERYNMHMKTLYNIIGQKARAHATDLEVRQRAIHALGVCVIRTSNAPNLLQASERAEALSIIEERLKNETTRLASIEAIDAIAAFSDKDSNLGATWIKSVALELTNQLRKSDLRLRASSLGALKKLATNPSTVSRLDKTTIESIANLLLPLLDANNLSSLGNAMNILTQLTIKAPTTVVKGALNDAVCTVVVATISGTTLDALLDLVEAIGSQGEGKSLMQGLLQKVGVNGDSTIVGSAIGALIVSGGSSVGVDTTDIITELDTAEDDQRKCLALCILGEVGLRLGAKSSLEPRMFLEHFKSKSDQIPRIAAMSMGRAGAGNPTAYLPIIITKLKAKGSNQPLLLHAVKELLQNASKSKIDLSGYSDVIWEKVIETSGTEDNKAIGAECIGTLVGFEPAKYLSSLQKFLRGEVASVRGLVIQAVRFALGDTDKTLDDTLKNTLTQLLVTMLSDDDVENRRLALGTLNSAVKHKPSLVIRDLQQLLPFVIKASEVDESLIREVKMGPFVHKVDDGLENRKSAYETLHTLIGTAYSRLDHQEIIDRVIAGLKDDYDIKALCNLMLTKLIDLDPNEVVRHLDPIGQSFQTTITTKLKDNAVRQEVEKAQEAAKDVLRTTVRLKNSFPTGSTRTGNVPNPLWRNYLELVNKDFKPQVRAAEDEVKLQA